MATVLLVEDDDSVRLFVRRALERAGHAVHEAGDGAAALQQMREGEAEPDLVLSDIQMPVLDGIALAEALARERPDLPLMLMTGYAHQRERALESAQLVRDVVEKPFTLAEICARVDGVLAACGDGATGA